MVIFPERVLQFRQLGLYVFDGSYNPLHVFVRTKVLDFVARIDKYVLGRRFNLVCPILQYLKMG